MSAYAFLTALFGPAYTPASIWTAFADEDGMPTLEDFFCVVAARTLGGDVEDYPGHAEAAHGLLIDLGRTPAERDAVEAVRRRRYAPKPAAVDGGSLFTALGVEL
jgi:hypothetical protein